MTPWNQRIQGSRGASLRQLRGDIDGSPILIGGRLYAGTNAGEVHALDPASGADLWTAPFAANDGPVKGCVLPRFGTSELLFSTTSRLWSIDDDGAGATLNWSGAAIPGPSISLANSAAGTPYVWMGGGDGRLYQLDLSAGSPPATLTSVLLGAGTATVGRRPRCEPFGSDCSRP